MNNKMIIFSFDVNEKYELSYEKQLIMDFCDDISNSDKYTYLYCTEPIKGSIPIGSVEWCELIYSKSCVDYYPEKFKEYFNRNINVCTFGDVVERILIDDNNDKIESRGYFIKSKTNGYKSELVPCVIDKNYFKLDDDEKSGMCNEICSNLNYHYNCKKVDMYGLDSIVYCSDFIKFDFEFRYYIVNGKCISKYCYDISDEKCSEVDKKIDMICEYEVPDFNYDLVDGFSGVVDMGLYNGKLTLIEVSLYYGCAWYPGSLKPKYGNHMLFGNFCIENHNWIMKNKNKIFE